MATSDIRITTCEKHSTLSIVSAACHEAAKGASC